MVFILWIVTIARCFLSSIRCPRLAGQDEVYCYSFSFPNKMRPDKLIRIKKINKVYLMKSNLQIVECVKWSEMRFEMMFSIMSFTLCLNILYKMKLKENYPIVGQRTWFTFVWSVFNLFFCLSSATQRYKVYLINFLLKKESIVSMTLSHKR